VADIAITCPQCATSTTVSEFADDANLQCRECGKTLKKPGAETADTEGNPVTTGGQPPPSKSGLRLKNPKQPQPLEDGDETVVPIIPPPEPENQTDSLELRPEIKSGKRQINHAIIAAGLFVVLGGVMGYLRYGGVLPRDILVMVREYAWLVFLAFNVAIVLKAMTDNIMQGVLCLLVPGYALFYLFGISDTFYLRAVFGGLLVGIGQDAVFKLNIHATKLVEIVHDFISRGGGDIR
jgi:hypothetical protein